MSNAKLGMICYVPPKRVYAGVESFLQNLKDFPPKNKLILYSDEYEGDGIIKLGGSVEIAKTPNNRMAVNNLIFFVGMRIAIQQGWTHVMVVENDTRVNVKHWDEVIFNEFLTKNKDAVCGGSMVVFNPASCGRKAAERYERFVVETNKTRPVPLSITASSNLAEYRDSSVFPNGAFAIYRIDWILKTFPEITEDTAKYVDLSQKSLTWDFEVAVRLWKEFREAVYDKVVHLDCIYSGYGNVMTTEEERRELLTSGRVVGVHQIKSDWRPEKKDDNNGVTNFEKVNGKTEIFICTYSRDFRYLKYCLRSIEKFVTGFSGVTILVPNQDLKELRQVVAENYRGSIPIKCKGGYEWKGKGFLWHEAMICRADEHCPEADYIAHIDPDCCFDAPCSPETFFRDGKPVLRYEPFETLCKREPGIWNWKIACDNALPFTVSDEGMRSHPEIYIRNTYELTRQKVEEKTKMPFNDYVRSCKNDFPQTFAEYPTLSAVAKECLGDSYHLHDCSKDENPDKSPWPVFQAWSHNPPDVATELMYRGQKQIIVPMDIYKQLGIS